MKALKTAVILMSVVIVAGFGFVVYTIVDRMMSGEPVLAARTDTPDVPDATASFGDIDLPVPLGCDLDSVQLEGQRLLITLDGLDDQRCKQIIVMDTTDGKVLGRVTLQPPL
ncbi:hypothetical protein [Pelagibius sp. Alg239-R121]|uniref:hypothetical protein n=1 Tax=Pelagibius sp. Alg239-R121 TaxID=2993448 RepID=UPI0024A73C20|nr:hypothetical protein [Pelagibius sp. Alg239-R121]